MKNKNNNNSRANSMLRPPNLLLLVALLGYFMFGVEGALATVLITLFYGLSTLLSFIPLAGIPLHFFLMIFVINPFIFDIAPVANNVLTTAIFWFFFGLGIILNLCVTSFTFGKNY